MTSNAASGGAKSGVAVLVLLGAVVFGGMQYYALDRDLDSFKLRAQVAANPTDMLTYVQLRTSIVQHDAHTGHTA